MSWSVAAIGTSENIKKYLDEYEASLSEPSKTEFGDVKPHLVGLLDQNVSCAGYFSLSASGHATFVVTGEERKKTNGYATVNIEQFYGKLLPAT